jgi:Tfp pilus assembly protein PilO
MTILLGIAAGIVVLIILYLLLGKKKNQDAADAAPEAKEEKNADYASKKFRAGLSVRMRNIIILSVLLIISLGWSFLAVKKVKKQHTRLVEEKAQVLREQDSTFTLTLEEPKVREKLAKLKEEAALNNKVILFGDNSTKSLEYFFDTADRYSDPLVFDFGQSESGTVKTDKEVTYNTYVITGKGTYNQILNFVNQIEVQPPFYSVESMALSILGAEREGTVEFSMELRAYSTAKGTYIEQIPLLPVKNRNMRYNPFFPGLHGVIPRDDAEFLSLLDVEDGKLIALTRDRAFVRTNSTGVIRMLSVGDQVRYGILKRIDWENQQAVFEVNRFGVAEPFRLSLEGAIQTNIPQEDDGFGEE